MRKLNKFYLHLKKKKLKSSLKIFFISFGRNLTIFIVMKNQMFFFFRHILYTHTHTQTSKHGCACACISSHPPDAFELWFINRTAMAGGGGGGGDSFHAHSSRITAGRPGLVSELLLINIHIILYKHTYMYLYV